MSISEFGRNLTQKIPKVPAMKKLIGGIPQMTFSNSTKNDNFKNLKELVNFLDFEKREFNWKKIAGNPLEKIRHIH